jgi:hypothetical protein
MLMKYIGTLNAEADEVGKNTWVGCNVVDYNN